jgi:hypothetical protein
LLNKELVGLHQSTATPPGTFLGYWTCDELAACGLWGRKVTPAGDVWVVALVNTGKNQSHKITLPFTKLGWSEKTVATVLDVWETPPTHYPNVTGSFEATVPVQGTVVVKVSQMK